jgi:hypothetical protein
MADFQGRCNLLAVQHGQQCVVRASTARCCKFYLIFLLNIMICSSPAYSRKKWHTSRQPPRCYSDQKNTLRSKQQFDDQ